MNGLELFQIWAPAHDTWSRWAKPVLFAEFQPVAPPVPMEWPGIDISQDQGTAIVVDLPGPESVQIGIALAREGYRPVPLFNSSAGPTVIFTSALVNVIPTQEMLHNAAPVLQNIQFPPKPAPAFLLDAKRSGSGTLSPNRYDNRSIIFPQDFPSATFFLSQGITRVLLYQEKETPAEDLAHVLLRWQEAGIQLFSYKPMRSTGAEPLRVAPPSQFKMLWQRALAYAGLKRNSAGGFGGLIPEVSSGSG